MSAFNISRKTTLDVRHWPQCAVERMPKPALHRAAEGEDASSMASNGPSWHTTFKIARQPLLKSRDRKEVLHANKCLLQPLRKPKQALVVLGCPFLKWSTRERHSSLLCDCFWGRFHFLLFFFFCFFLFLLRGGGGGGGGGAGVYAQIKGWCTEPSSSQLKG